MPQFRYRTAGESHGPCLLAIVEGFPYGTPFDPAPVNAELARRQGGHGRGARMKAERDEVEIQGGVRHGRMIGSPLVLAIRNRVADSEALGPITKPRPGHADLAGALKFGATDARDVSERASARETAARVAAGAAAQSFVAPFGIRVIGFALEIGGLRARRIPDDPGELARRRDASSVYLPDADIEPEVLRRIDQARADGDTLGGVVEVRAHGVPPGLGGYASWEQKLDGRLARALMAVQTIKGVEIGAGFEGVRRPGSTFHDPVERGPDGGITRPSNHAGGIEGGLSNGMPIVVRAASKPIPTLRHGLPTVDLSTGEPCAAPYERSDVCVVPAASVVAQAVVAFEIAAAFLEKFGADTYEEVQRRHGEYLQTLRRFAP